jgi:hypothetical protein
MTHLHIFALNEPVTMSHTNLTRQQGETPVLPPLAAWLGAETLDTDAIELFPISELGGMALSDYVQLAFTPEAMPREVQARLDALDGAVLLVPDDAMTGMAAPGPQVTEIAKIRLAQADHDAHMPPARLDTAATVTPGPAPEQERAPPLALIALLVMLAFAAVIVLFGWGR